MRRKIICVVSTIDNTILGVGGDLAIKSPIDMKHFKSTTTGKFLVMGRKTCESLPFKLPGRHSHVITTNVDYDAQGKADTFGPLDMEQIQQLAEDYYGYQQGDIYLIGGAGLIESMLNEIDEVIETAFTNINIIPSDGEITQFSGFTRGDMLTVDTFIDHDAKYLPRPSSHGSVSGIIMHYINAK